MIKNKSEIIDKINMSHNFINDLNKITRKIIEKDTYDNKLAYSLYYSFINWNKIKNSYKTKIIKDEIYHIEDFIVYVIKYYIFNVNFDLIEKYIDSNRKDKKSLENILIYLALFNSIKQDKNITNLVKKIIEENVKKFEILSLYNDVIINKKIIEKFESKEENNDLLSKIVKLHLLFFSNNKEDKILHFFSLSELIEVNLNDNILSSEFIKYLLLWLILNKCWYTKWIFLPEKEKNLYLEELLWRDLMLNNYKDQIFFLSWPPLLKGFNRKNNMLFWIILWCLFCNLLLILPYFATYIDWNNVGWINMIDWNKLDDFKNFIKLIFNFIKNNFLTLFFILNSFFIWIYIVYKKIEKNFNSITK